MPGCSRFGGPLSGALDEAAKLRHDCVYIFRPHTTKRQRVEPAGFVVGNFYLNMLPGEERSHRHVCWDELLPDACESAVFTSLFPDASYNWLREASAGKRIRRMLLIADRCPKLPKNPPPTLCEPHDNWFVLEGQRTAGLVHCALMLFRTSLFLRVVICGTNLDGQLDRDRDSLFVQVRVGRL